MESKTNLIKEYFWKTYSSRDLTQWCSKYFLLWWDAERFDWKYSFSFLAQYCSRYFLLWWDEKRILTVPSGLYFSLAQHCSAHFSIWWPVIKNKWNWQLNTHYLELYCQQYHKIWNKEYTKYISQTKED